VRLACRIQSRREGYTLRRVGVVFDTAHDVNGQPGT
jgi:hypothetical protein